MDDDDHYDSLMYGGDSGAEPSGTEGGDANGHSSEVDSDLEEEALGRIHFVPTSAFRINKLPRTPAADHAAQSQAPPAPATPVITVDQSSDRAPARDAQPSAATGESFFSLSEGNSHKRIKRSRPTNEGVNAGAGADSDAEEDSRYSATAAGSAGAPAAKAKQAKQEADEDEDDGRIDFSDSDSDDDEDRASLLVKEEGEVITSLTSPGPLAAAAVSKVVGSVSIPAEGAPSCAVAVRTVVAENEVKLASPLPESLPFTFHTIDTDKAAAAMGEDGDERRDYGQWDDRKYVMKSRYWIKPGESMFDRRGVGSSPAGRQRPRDPLDPISELPCLRCSNYHKTKCMRMRCCACAAVDDHEIWDCPMLRAAKCRLCRGRWHTADNCAINLPPERICKACDPKLEKHSVEACPRLFRQYLRNPEPSGKPVHTDCAKCGAGNHLADDCKKEFTGKVQTPWNALPLKDRQATVLEASDLEAGKDRTVPHMKFDEVGLWSEMRNAAAQPTATRSSRSGPPASQRSGPKGGPGSKNFQAAAAAGRKIGDGRAAESLPKRPSQGGGLTRKQLREEERERRGRESRDGRESRNSSAAGAGERKRSRSRSKSRSRSRSRSVSPVRQRKARPTTSGPTKTSEPPATTRSKMVLRSRTATGGSSGGGAAAGARGATSSPAGGYLNSRPPDFPRNAGPQSGPPQGPPPTSASDAANYQAMMAYAQIQQQQHRQQQQYHLQQPQPAASMQMYVPAGYAAGGAPGPAHAPILLQQPHQFTYQVPMAGAPALAPEVMQIMQAVAQQQQQQQHRHPPHQHRHQQAPQSQQQARPSYRGGYSFRPAQ